MSDPLPKDDESLEALRREIDAVDAEMHSLLIRRGEVIERLIAAKRADATGSAFRPDREAAMLARLSERHTGVLPLATVEHVWREIIGTFTQLQAPFRVHSVDASDGAMRDLLRFHFGFAAPLVDHAKPGDVIAAIHERTVDLGVVPLDSRVPGWWSELSGAPGGVKVIAVLPFLSKHDGWPASYVLGSSAITNAMADVAVYSAQCEKPAAPGQLGQSTRITAADGSLALLEGPQDPSVLRKAAEGAGVAFRQLEAIGGYCAPPSQ